MILNNDENFATVKYEKYHQNFIMVQSVFKSLSQSSFIDAWHGLKYASVVTLAMTNWGIKDAKPYIGFEKLMSVYEPTSYNLLIDQIYVAISFEF